MKDQSIPILFGIFFINLLIIAYLNHFDNGFYFDDTHTISNNEAITEFNLSAFFSDPATFSSLPANRAYRPMVTTLNSMSYQFGNGLNPIVFHIHMFFWYVVQLVMMFFFLRNLLNRLGAHQWNTYFALFATAFYGLHAANAETINYLISISDSFSTMCVVATLLAYQVEWSRKRYIYLITLIIGIFTKQTAVVAVPILMIYIWLFEENFELTNRETLKKSLIATLKKSIPMMAVGVGLFLFNQLAMTPESTVSLNAQASKLRYFTTQFFVAAHYIGNFILPLNLSADPDFEIITSVFDARILLGGVLILAMLLVAFASFRNKQTFGIGFGILWFYLALLPTSSFIPLYQIANDHRTFFPYIGLVIALITAIRYFMIKHEESLRSSGNKLKIITAAATLVIGCHAYGTYQRNEVWHTSESLWHDVTIKSPRNGRGLMNYALTLMSKGQYDETLDYFTRALELLPHYSYLHINMGILKNAMGLPEEAEQYYKNGLRYGSQNPECYLYYAKFLHGLGRREEAWDLLNKGHDLSPGHKYINNLMLVWKNQPRQDPTTVDVQIPDNLTEDAYLNISRNFYQQRNYKKCIEACELLLKLNPKSALAYNNMCSAYIKLGMYDKALVACKTALTIQPDFQLAKNNLQWARTEYHKRKNQLTE